MNESNKGRFKVADEAQAVWNLYVKQVYAFPELIEWFKKDVDNSHFDWLANNLHEARLIHGSIYDEHGRIDDKDVAFDIAKVIYTDFDFFEFDDSELEQAIIFILNIIKEVLNIRGTIFY